MLVPADEIRNQLELLAQYEIECVIIGGVAANYHGTDDVTHDLDVCYARDSQNLERIVNALRSVNAFLRGAPREVPFILDAETLQKGVNFTFETTVGSLDLLGEIRGVGGFSEALSDAEEAEILDHSFRILSLPKLIESKRVAGRPKDLRTLLELEAIYEYQQSLKSDES